MAYYGDNTRVSKPVLYENKKHRDVVVFPGRLPPNEIAFINMLIDDVDGIVVMRTEDPEIGKMEYWVAPDLVDEFKKMFEAIKAHTGIDMSLGEPLAMSTEMAEYIESQKGE